MTTELDLAKIVEKALIEAGWEDEPRFNYEWIARIANTAAKAAFDAQRNGREFRVTPIVPARGEKIRFYHDESTYRTYGGDYSRGEFRHEVRDVTDWRPVDE